MARNDLALKKRLDDCEAQRKEEREFRFELKKDNVRLQTENVAKSKQNDKLVREKEELYAWGAGWKARCEYLEHLPLTAWALTTLQRKRDMLK